MFDSLINKLEDNMQFINELEDMLESGVSAMSEMLKRLIPK